MVKKVFCFILILVIMPLCLMGLAACNSNAGLAEYKTAGKGLIDAHVATKLQIDYSTENWTLVCKAVIDGKEAVDAVRNREGVDTAVANTKQAIDEVKWEAVKMGPFYSLQQAYDTGLLTVQNLEGIATYHNSGATASDTLSSAIENAIKEAAAEKLRNDISEATAEDFFIRKYYGIYDNSVAIILNAPYQENTADIVDEWVTIAGVSFHYIGHSRITIWNQK